MLGLVACASLTVPEAAEAAPYFQEVPSAFGVEPCAKSGCWTNYLELADLDGDGDLDVIMPNADGYFSKGNEAQPLLIYENDGSGSLVDASATTVGGYAGWLRQIAVGDVDGDGDLDLYAPDAWGGPDKYFINAGDGRLADELATLNPGAASHAGAARFGDVDDDGDLDLLVSDGWAKPSAFVAHLYLNDGTGRLTDATANLPTTKAGTDPIDFDLFDADGDFDLDLLINMHQGKNSLWLNDGAGRFTDATAGFPKPAGKGGLHYDPVTCDVDGDGDLDVWIDNIGGGYKEQLLINDGSGAFSDETSARVSGNVAADDNGVACIDVDGDGDLDAAIMSLSNNERVLLNDGTGHFTLLPGAFTTEQDGTLWFDFGDLNGDGKLDCVTGQGESSFIDRVYLGTETAPSDVRPPAFRAVEQVTTSSADAEVVVHFAVVDDATTDTGPRLRRAYAKVSARGSTDEVPAVFMGGDLFRAVLPAHAIGTTVTYVACAVDWANNEGCAAEHEYVVGVDSSTGPGGSGAGAGSTTGAAGASSTSGEGGGDSLVPSDESGCGCRVPATAEPTPEAGLAALALGALARRRRRRSEPARATRRRRP